MTAHLPAGEVARQLWQRLLAEPWPLPPQALPPGSALVGGAVRDALLGRLERQPDLDVVVMGDAIALARQLARAHGGSAVVLDAEHGIARLVLRGWSIDLARCEGPSLEADLGRRDFTINAIALPLPPPGEAAPTLLDPSGGLAHLASRQLVAVSEANLLADPLRLLRGIRLACSLGFAIEPATHRWIGRHAAALAGVAGERVLAELEKLAIAPAGEQGLGQALQLGLLQPWLAGGSAAASPTPVKPGIPLGPPALAQLTLELARQRGLEDGETAWALPLARLAALLSPEALAALRSSRRLQQRCRLLRRWQRQLEAEAAWAALPEGQQLALHRELEADLPALLLLLPETALHDLPQPPALLLERWRQPDDPLLHPRAPLDGRSLQQQLGIPAGPELGRLLDHLTLERAFGRLAAGAGASAAALQAAERWWAQHNPPARANHDGEPDGRRD